MKNLEKALDHCALGPFHPLVASVGACTFQEVQTYLVDNPDTAGCCSFLDENETAAVDTWLGFDNRAAEG